LVCERNNMSYSLKDNAKGGQDRKHLRFQEKGVSLFERRKGKEGKRVRSRKERGREGRAPGEAFPRKAYLSSSVSDKRSALARRKRTRVESKGGGEPEKLGPYMFL